jgi:hypothetical protein
MTSIDYLLEEYIASVFVTDECLVCHNNPGDGNMRPLLMDIEPADRDIFPAERVAACICLDCANSGSKIDYLTFFNLLLELVENYPYAYCYKDSEGKTRIVRYG